MEPTQIQTLDRHNRFRLATQQNQPSSVTHRNLVFIDTAVADYQTLMSGVEKGTQVILLHPEWDGVEQITTALSQQTDDITTVHIVSHGSPGCLYLGNSCLNLKTLEFYASLLEQWFSKGSTPSLLLYGCDIAATDIGIEFLAKLRQKTGANIAASSTPTGNPALGGNWKLEVTTEKMTIALAFPVATQVAYTGVLNPNRISIGASGNQTNDNSFRPAISASGRYIAFRSDASNLVANDTNNLSDIFVYDTETGISKRVSIGSSGVEGNNAANGNPAISGDGRYVVFESYASNLVADDTNNFSDIFVYDTQTLTTKRVSVDSQGNQGNSVSSSPTVSGDGRYVAFESYASNLVADDTNNFNDIFVYDTQTRTTSRVSVNSQSNQGNNASFSPAISADGRYVAFESFASNLVPEDTNNTRDIFVYDTQTRTTNRVPVNSQGNQGNQVSFSPSISGNGRYVAFASYANNLVPGDTNNTADIFLYDTQTGITSRVSVDSQGNQGNDESFSPSISADGRYVAFASYANNLVAGDTNDTADIFVYDTQTRTTKRVSIDSQRNQGNDLSYNSVISASGRYVAYESYASNLVTGDTNDSRDIFLYDTISNNAPINLALSATSVDEKVPVATAIGAFTTTDPDANDQHTYSLVTGTGDTDNAVFSINGNKLLINNSPNFASKSSYNIRARTTDNGGLSFDKQFTINVNQGVNKDGNKDGNKGNDSPIIPQPILTPELTQIASDVFTIKGNNNQVKLSVKLTQHTSSLVNEVGVFTVDDAQGRINGIVPGSAGYSEAALNRSQVIFSALANIPNGFDTNLTRKLAFDSNANLRFYLVPDSTTDTVLFGNTSLTKVVFPSPANFKVETLNNGEFSLAWKDPLTQNGDFNGFGIKVKATNEEFSLGTSLQGKPQDELIDLRQVNTQVKADFILNREAAFSDFIGFYEIADDKGGIDTNGDGIVDYRPGDAGYIQAAVKGRVPGIDLTVNNQATANFSGTFKGGSLFAPFIIVNGKPDALLDSNSNNDPQIYFPFLGANSDKADHICLLGDNVFGFEDLVNGGDRDYNDLTVRINLSKA